MAYTSHSLRTSVIACTVAALALGGCANMSETQKGTGIGAGIGAVAGALIGGNKTGAAVGGAVGALGGYVWSKHMQDKKAAMEQATAGTGVAVTQTADNQLKLNIPSDISFDTGRSDIKPNLRPILDQFANGLQNQPGTEVRIIGHTDSTGSDAINDPLSLHRAESARNYLTSRSVDGRRIVVEGRGDHEPVADNRTEDGRARNRRVEIYLAERAQ
ncbi:OmpA family protein [Rhodoferax sp.]|uniref:OmpA family protein n=1 Tax=Rhodoferax sp. TaxID=50421 RepID=UPI00374D7C0B